ncbi:MAG: undecaprenyl-diphosphatase UppP [Candidatus Levybacteria bacterium]|nr:undecaprenyl-diphosphatase UppP [Candidatus Levybacteria bacterium]
MGIIQTLILSAIEGITEFLPVSSTGHLILTSHVLSIEQTEFVKSFLIIIQLGAILSVVTLYFRRLTNVKIWPKIIAGFIPSAVVGLLLYSFIKESLIGNILVTVAALFVGGFAFIGIELWDRQREKSYDFKDLTTKKAFLIGLFQSISIIPGVSRAGASILGGLILGFNRKASTEFSFLLAVPTMLGATSLDVFKTRLNFSNSELVVLSIGFIASYLFALLAVKFLIDYIKNHTFIAFGVYRIIIAIVFYLIFIS